MKKKNRLGATVCLVIFLVGVIAPTAIAATSFSDIKGHWARESIIRLAGLGHLKGYPDGTFRPDNSMSRAEFVTALIACLGADHKDTITSNFNDTTHHWAKTQINEAVRRGILKPWEYPNGLKPDGAIKRSEVAAMLVRASGKSAGNSKVTFKDDTAVQQSDYRDFIRTACAEKLMAGYPDGEFKPFNNMTRAEVTTVLSTFLGISSPAPSPNPNPNPVLPNSSGWSLVIEGNYYDPATTPVYIKTGFNDVRITSIFAFSDRVLFNNTYSYSLDSSTSNLQLVIHNNIFDVSKLSVKGNQLLISSSAMRLNTVTVGDHKYSSDFVKLYISNTNGDYYLSDAILLDQYTIKIGSKSYDLARHKITIALGEKYYDIKRVILNPTLTSLELAETDPVISSGLSVSSFSAIIAGKTSLDLDAIKDIDFIIDRSMYSLDQVTIDASGNFTADGDNYSCTEATMIINGTFYRINSITMFKGKFMVYAEADEKGDRIVFNEEYRYASEVQIIKNNISYDLDRVIVVDRNLIRIGGKQYKVDASVKCRFNNKLYDIDRINYDTKYEMVIITATESSDYVPAYQPRDYVFYLGNTIYQDGLSDDVTIYVNGSYRSLDAIDITDPGHFTYRDDTYSLFNTRLRIGNKEFNIVDTAWHGQSQIFDLYLKKI